MKSSKPILPFESLIERKICILFKTSFIPFEKGVVFHINGVRYPTEGQYPKEKVIEVEPVVWEQARFLAKECGKDRDISFNPTEYGIEEELEKVKLDE